MTKVRDIITFLGKTEKSNTQNQALITSANATSTITAEAGNGVAGYDTPTDLPLSGNDSGDMAFVSSTNRLYLWNGLGWYNIALINNTPTLSISPSGAITLTVGTDTTITLIGADSEGIPLTYSVESDGNFGDIASLTQDSSVFTIHPLSADSGGIAGTSTLTFKASDGINFATGTSEFSLTLSSIVDSSAETVLLMKAAGNNATNAAITYQNSSDVSTGWTENGTPQANTFTPYRSGGYSAYFDGADDYLTISDDNSLDVGTGDFTLEAWFYLNVDDGSYNICSQYSSGNSGGLWLGRYSGGFNFRRAGVGDVITASSLPSVGEWHHVAVSRASGSTKMFIDGTQTGSTVASDTNNYSVSAPFYIGIDTPTDPGEMNGYIRDFRLIKGTGLYTTNFTPPTESLTAVSGTSLLACHLPYFADGSTNDHTITINGNTSTQPFGPYDYEPWTADDHAGSVYFDGDGDTLSVAHDTDNTLGGADFTIEFWAYHNVTSGYGVFIAKRNSGGAEYQIFFNPTTYLLAFYRGGASQYNGTAVINSGVWHHIAMTYDHSATTVKLYHNGKLTDTNASYTFPATTGLPLVIGDHNVSPNAYYNGYMSDIRFTKDIVYTSDFTPPTAPLDHITNTSLLMNNKSDANVYDAAAANTFELINDTKSSTTQRKFSTSSAIYFDGTNDRMQVRDFELAGDLTVEGWFYQTATQSASYRCLVGTSTYTGSTPFGLFTYNTQVQLWGIQNGVQITGSFTANTWHHVAVVRNSGTWTLYIDGTSQGTNTNNGTYSFANTTDWQWGCGPVNLTINDFTGYMQDWRISDRAVYTSNFTAPTAEFEL